MVIVRENTNLQDNCIYLVHPSSGLEVWHRHARFLHHSIERGSLRAYFLLQVWERAPGFGDVLLTDTIWEAINEVSGSPPPCPWLLLRNPHRQESDTCAIAPTLVVVARKEVRQVALMQNCT